MNKKSVIYILIILFVAILAVSSVSAWWDTFECEGFSIDMPDGVTKATGYSPTTPPKHVELVTKSGDTRWNFVSADLSEVPIENLPDYIDVVENQTKGDVTIVKGQVIGSVSYDFFDGNNITYAEFNKDGKHFYLSINHNYRTLDEIDLNKDIELTNAIKESIKVK
jgi:hypothetical protein